MDPNLLLDADMEPDPELNEWTNRILGVAFEVHTQLGAGFLEAIYQNALEHELRLRGIPFQRQVKVRVRCKDILAGEGCIDLIVGDRIVVEIKCVEAISAVYVAQAISYLRATGVRLCLIINFRVKRLRDGIGRIAL